MITQDLTTDPPGNNCALTLPGGPLVQYGHSGPVPSYLDKGGTQLLALLGPGANCARIEVDNSIDFSLDPTAFPDGTFFTEFRIALNGKFNVVVDFIINPGMPDQEEFRLYTGKSAAEADCETGCVVPPGYEGVDFTTVSSDTGRDADDTNAYAQFEAVAAHGRTLRVKVVDPGFPSSSNGVVGIGGNCS